MVNDELVRPGTSPAHASYGSWVALCGRPDRCSWGEALQRFQSGFICPACGAATEVIWPEPGIVAGVERLLMMRPHFKNRNWVPGETLHDLMLENGANGVFDGLPLTERPTALLTVTDTGIRLDALPGNPDRFALNGEA